MATSEHPLDPVLRWLSELKVITENDRETFEGERGTKAFFDDMRNGYILAKIALLALPNYATTYRTDLCTSAVTRYYIIRIHF